MVLDPSGIALFHCLQGILQMRYLWQEELSLSDDKLHNLLGADLPATDIHTILATPYYSVKTTLGSPTV